MTKNNTKIMKKRSKLTVFTSPISLETLNLSLELSFNYLIKMKENNNCFKLLVKEKSPNISSKVINI